MFKLQLTFVTLALISGVLSSPIPTPSQQMASTGEVQALNIPGLGAVSDLLGGLGLGGGGDDSESNGDDSSSGGLLGLKRQFDDAPDIFDTLLKRQDDDGSDDDVDNSGDDTGSDTDVSSRQDADGTADSGDSGDDNGDDTSSREDNLPVPFLGGGRRRFRGGLRGPPEHTGLAGLGDNLGDALTSLGAGLGQLLKRQDGLIGPPEHTGLAGLGDNLGDALTSLGEGLGQLLKRQDEGDDSGDETDDSGDDSGEDNLL